MTKKLLPMLMVVVVVAVAAFGVGYWIRGDGEMHPPIYTADCSTGAAVASCQVGDTTYGFRSTVSWTDSTGSFHDDGWPECLPHMQTAKAVRFAANVVWVGSMGTSRILWVDCQSH